MAEPGYDLRYEVDPALYRRAVTQPIAPRDGRVTVLRNLLAVLLAAGAVWAADRALFGGVALAPLATGFGLGAAVVLAVWWRQHLALVGHHARYNETGGEMRLAAGPDGIVTSRPGIESRIAWSFVRGIREIEGAVLIDLPAARLIVPDTALPGGDHGPFAADLRRWQGVA